MKVVYLILLLFLSSCFAGRTEFQVRPSHVTVIEVEEKEPYGSDKILVVRMVADNNIRYYLETSINNKDLYQVGARFHFLSPR